MIIAFARKGQEISQYHEEEFPSLLASGEIPPSDRYWHEGLTEGPKVYERWSVPEPPEPTPKKTPSAPKPTTPVIKTESGPNAQRSGPGILFYLIAALLIGAGLYWLLSQQQPPPECPAPGRGSEAGTCRRTNDCFTRSNRYAAGSSSGDRRERRNRT
jgi:hypothetical protein